MAQANLRLTAGVGAMAACLLVAGAGAALAVADPGGGHSGHSGQSGNGNGNGSRSRSTVSNNAVATVNTATVNTATVSSAPSSKFGSGRDVATAAQRPSSDLSPGPRQFKPPKVTFGDGRNPDVQHHDSRRGWQGPAPVPAPPPPPQVIAVPLNPPAIEPSPQQHGFVEQLVAEPTGGLADPLWGVAGLLLIPAAGAIVGYRQARAAQSAAHLGRRP